MRLSLGRWFLLWMLLVTTVTLVLSVAVVTLRQRALLTAELEARGRQVARIAANADPDSGVRSLALAAVPECVAMTVRTSGGHLLWSYGPEPGLMELGEDRLVQVAAETRPQPFDGSEHSPVRVVMHLSTAGINAQVLDTGGRLAVSLGAALAAALLGGVLLVNRVVEPLQALAEAARQLSPEAPAAVAIPRGGAGEVIDLATAFQQMAERLGDQRRRTFDEMSDGVALVDDDGGLLLSNRAMNEFSDAVGPQLADLDPGVQREEWQCSVGDRVLRCALTRPEGMEHRILVVRDITRWRETEERLREAQKMEAVATLAGGVAHDFNNLLAGIQLHLRLLERDPDSAPDAIATIRALADEGAEVVRELIRFAHPEATPETVVDLAALLADQEAMLRHLLPPSVRFELIRDGGVRAPVRARASELRRVVLNLVLNARNAVADEGGRIVVALHVTADAALVEVRDTGPGVPPELRDRVFEPFFSLRREGRGAGIGLAVVYSLVREAGGEVTVGSAPEGGALFRLQFPLCHEAETELDAGSERPAGTPGAVRGERLLVVEDELALAEALAAELSAVGYELRCANSLASARRVLEDFTPELVVADLLLPDGRGDELVRELRERYPYLPVLFISGTAAGEAEALRGWPHSRLLAKPFAMEELFEQARRLLDHAATQQSERSDSTPIS